MWAILADEINILVGEQGILHHGFNVSNDITLEENSPFCLLAAAADDDDTAIADATKLPV